MYAVGASRPCGDEDGGGDDGVEQRRDRHELAAGRGVGIDGDAVRKVADLVLDQPHVVPRVGLEKIHARAAGPERSPGEDIVPRRPHAQAGGHDQRMRASIATSNLRTMRAG